MLFHKRAINKVLIMTWASLTKYKQVLIPHSFSFGQITTKTFYKECLKFYQNKNFDEALKCFTICTEAFSSENNLIISYYMRGLTNYKLDFFRNSIDDFNKVLLLLNNLSDTNDYKNEVKMDQLFQYRGECYYNLNDYENALEDYSKAIEYNNQNAEVYSDRGLMLLNNEEIELAKQDYEKALEISPNDLDYLYVHAFLLQRMNDMENSLKEFNKILEIDKNYVDAYLSRADIYIYLNDIDKACSDFEEAKKLGDENAQNMINKYCK